MADIDRFAAFVLRWAAGATRKPGESLDALFKRAKKTGWSDHPLDRGGATMCDVTLRTYETYCRRKGYPRPTATRLKAIPYAQWRDILRTMYWDKWLADRIADHRVAVMLVDWLWASGTAGIKEAQRVLGVKADGIVGPKTLGAVEDSDPTELLRRLHEARVAYCEAIVRRNPTQKRWLRGWLNRIDSIMEE